jgi:6-phosphogluconolactonase
MNWKHTVLLAVAVACLATVSMAQSNDFNPFSGQAGFVYTETNGANNAVLVFNRAANGSLTLAATVPTGGLGGGVVSVGSQGALALSQDGRWLFVANEGDGSISVMERTASGLKAVGKVSTGGTLPVSITVSRNLVYVLNDGVHGASPAQPASITGFFFDSGDGEGGDGGEGGGEGGDGFRGALEPIPNSTRSLSVASPTVPAAGPLAAEIHFDNSGLFLYVTEVGTNIIDTYSVNFDGTPSEDRIQQSFGDSPFAFAFDPRGNLFVTEVREAEGIAGTSAVTSYEQNREGILNAISGSVLDHQTAACWIAITPDGQYAYVVNTASAVISGYQVGFRGELSLLGNGVTAQTTRGPLDNAFSRDGRYLYDVTATGAILGFKVQADGSLTSLGLTVTAPAGSRGLVAE